MRDLYPYRSPSGLWFCRVNGATLAGTLTQRAAWRVFRTAQAAVYGGAA